MRHGPPRHRRPRRARPAGTRRRRARRLRAVLAALAGLGAAGAAVGMASASTPAAGARGTRAWVRDAPSAPRLPRHSTALRSVPGGTDMRVDVVLKPRDPAALEAFDAAVSTPGSARFRHYLAPGDFAAAFGPAPSVTASVRSWLAGRGLAVGATSPDGLLVPVTGTADQMSRAFDVGLEQYRLPTGRVARAPTEAPLVPGALADDLYGVVGLDDVTLPVPELAWPTGGPGARDAAPAGPAAAPRTAAAPHAVPAHVAGPVASAGCDASIDGSSRSNGALTADQLAQAYSFSDVYADEEGAGTTVGVYELEPYSSADITMFEDCYSPAITTVPTGVSVDFASVHSGPQQGEAALDTEMVIGMAPQASVKVYVGPNGGAGPVDTYDAMAQDGSLDVITTSWGQCEPQTPPAVLDAESAIFQEAVAGGKTVTAAAGDAGSEDCFVFPSTRDTSLQVDDPASEPWVTGVGGTTLEALGPAPSETPWNHGVFAGTGGGGVSTSWVMPSWQLGPGVQSPYTKARDAFTGANPCPIAAGGAGSCREVPDVAGDADPATGFAVAFDGQWVKIGGTSMAAPLWGALAALADQGQPSTVGFMDPALYEAGCQGGGSFNDVTVGDNEPAGSAPSDPPATPSGPYYPATGGYDMASGLGTPDAGTLVGALRAPPGPVCPTATALSAGSGPAGGGTVVTVSGSNLAGVTGVSFGPGNAATVLARSSSSVTVVAPPSPTGGWDDADVFVASGADVLGYDGSLPFQYVGARGYWLVASDGGIFSFGQVGFHGSMGGHRLNQPIVGMAPTASGQGYWEVASDGGIFSFGDARFLGSTGGIRLVKPVVAMAPTPDGRGYWLVASDGGIFAYGDAGFFGSMGGQRLNQPIVGMTPTPDGRGYWEVASDGGIFSFGDARFLGSTGGIRLNKPVVGMAATPDGAGYWLVASDGGIFAYGDAPFDGSTGGIRLARAIVGMAPTPDGHGYWLVASDGGVFAYGGRYGGFFGSTGGIRLVKPVVGMGAP